MATSTTPSFFTKLQVVTGLLIDIARRRIVMSVISSRRAWRQPQAALSAACLSMVVALAIPGYTQTVTSKKNTTAQQETSITQLATVQVDTALYNSTTEIRPFHVNVPEEQLGDLRQRLAATRWPDKETIADRSQGVQLVTMKELVRYWQTNYDWRKVEARLNALPQFVTTIDGLDIHFIHVRSKYANALPVIITHGWPGSIIDQLKIIGPLTDPTAYGGKAEDAFDLVIPSLPGYGFSGKPATTGWDPIRIARAWIVLMKRLGYTRFVAQGGDWGNAVTEQMALQTPPGLIGIHTNMAATVPADVATALQFGNPQPAGLSADEKYAWDQLDFFYKHGVGYSGEMANRPQTLHPIANSPVALAPWLLDHDAASYALIARVFEGRPEGLTRKDVVENISLYWFTNTAVSSARL